MSVSTISYSAKISSLNPTTSHLSRFTCSTSAVHQHIFVGCFFDYSRTPWSSSTSRFEKSPSLTHHRGYLSKTPMLFQLWMRKSMTSSRSSRRFRLPSLHILHVRCKFCVIRAVGKKPPVFACLSTFAQKINRAS